MEDFNEFNKYLVLVVIFMSLILAIITELISYFFVLRKSDYYKLQNNLTRTKSKLDKMKLKEKSGIIIENTTISSNFSLPKTKRDPKIEVLEQSITSINQKMSMIKLKSSFLTGLLFALLIPFRTYLLGDVPVCKLPFEPIPVFRMITQAGLSNCAPNEAGSIFIFGQAFMAFRIIIQKAVFMDATSSFGKI
ncbi:hypothetical protein ACR3K2_04280 [Cryptosporidium serpentis]